MITIKLSGNQFVKYPHGGYIDEVACNGITSHECGLYTTCKECPAWQAEVTKEESVNEDI